MFECYFTEIPHSHDDPDVADEDEEEDVQTGEGQIDMDTDTETQIPQKPKSKGKYSTLILLLNASWRIFHSVAMSQDVDKGLKNFYSVPIGMLTSSVECLA